MKKQILFHRRQIRPWGIIILLLLLVAINLFGQDFPNPVGYVNDFANVIPSEFEEKISLISTEIKQKTGAEISVVTIETTGDLDYNIYAVKLFEKWEIGEKEKDNGILILNVVGDRKIKIEVGYGLEGIIPDGLAGEILDENIIPYLKEGDYGSGLLSGTIAVAKIIAKDAGVELTGDIEMSTKKGKGKKGLGIFPIIVFIIILIILSKLGFFGSGSGFGGKGSGSRGKYSGFGGNWGSGWGGFSKGGGSGGFGGFGGGFSGGGGAGRSY